MSLAGQLSQFSVVKLSSYSQKKQLLQRGRINLLALSHWLFKRSIAANFSDQLSLANPFGRFSLTHFHIRKQFFHVRSNLVIFFLYFPARRPSTNLCRFSSCTPRVAPVVGRVKHSGQQAFRVFRLQLWIC